MLFYRHCIILFLNWETKKRFKKIVILEYPKYDQNKASWMKYDIFTENMTKKLI